MQRGKKNNLCSSVVKGIIRTWYQNNMFPPPGAESREFMAHYQDYIEYRGGSCKPRINDHPCYSEQAHRKFGRVHVPVAPKCNIQCNYCVRKYACANENRPGVTVDVVSPEQAMETVNKALDIEPRIRVIGIAGPGDALANDETFQTLAMARDTMPSLTRCLSTNGLLLPDRIEDLYQARVTSLTITINAIDPEIGQHIYSGIRYQGKLYRGREAFEILSRNQLEGMKMAAERGMVVKVNSILMPGINETHLIEVAKAARERGAYIMNVMPLIPVPESKFGHMAPPSAAMLERVRNECEAIINQFRSCTQCRADAIGVPGEAGCGGDDIQTRVKRSGHDLNITLEDSEEDADKVRVPVAVKGAYRSGLF
jgi:nitrogen fixation protein NifB